MAYFKMSGACLAYRDSEKNTVYSAKRGKIRLLIVSLFNDAFSIVCYTTTNGDMMDKLERTA